MQQIPPQSQVGWWFWFIEKRIKRIKLFHLHLKKRGMVSCQSILQVSSFAALKKAQKKNRFFWCNFFPIRCWFDGRHGIWWCIMLWVIGWKVELLFDVHQWPVWLIWFAFASYFGCYKLGISMWWYCLSLQELPPVIARSGFVRMSHGSSSFGSGLSTFFFFFFAILFVFILVVYKDL